MKRHTSASSQNGCGSYGLDCQASLAEGSHSPHAANRFAILCQVQQVVPQEGRFCPTKQEGLIYWTTSATQAGAVPTRHQLQVWLANATSTS